jgi:hypothetical protein
MIAISPAIDHLSTDAQRRYLEAHLKDALIDLRLAHPAHKARCQDRVDALLHKLAEVVCA